MSVYDPDKFAEWLLAAYEESRFKSHSALAKAAGLQRSTVSGLIGTKDQPLTGKPSQPKAKTVIALATALNKNVNEALMLAGHAPKNNNNSVPSFIFTVDWQDLNESEKTEIEEFVKYVQHRKDSQRLPLHVSPEESRRFLREQFGTESIEEVMKIVERMKNKNAA